MKGFFIILFIGFSSVFYKACAGECPDNRTDYFCVTPEMAPEAEVKIADFYTIPSQIISLFSNELSQEGRTLSLNAQWESPFFGAGAGLSHNQYTLMILGGTVRIEGMTADAYAAIVCHEIGHMIGGAPFQSILGSGWSSSEGQSDFFAASVCLPHFFRSRGVADDEIKNRVEKAGYEMIHSFSLLNKRFQGSSAEVVVRYKKDESVVKEVLSGYPTLQCRYENFRNPIERPACWFK